MPQSISCYIICKNEEQNIEACLRSVAFCDQIVVVDSFSTDATMDILRSLEAELKVDIYQREWAGFPAQKQFALSKCTSDWCLCLDADERLQPDFIPVLRDAIEDPKYNALKIKFRPFLYGYGYAHPWTHMTGVRRVSRRGTAHYNLSKNVHEELVVEGETRYIRSVGILHRGAPAYKEQTVKATQYADAKARDRFASGKKPSLFRMLFSPVGYFIKNYLISRYFLNGLPGFIFCVRLMKYAFATEAILYQLHRGEIPPGSEDPDSSFLSH